MGLATKITLPFIALFALVLIALGVLLAREILGEVEVRVEDEHRFALEVATFPGFELGEDALRQIRDRISRSTSGNEPGRRSEFVVLQDGAPTLTTVPRSARAAWPLVEALQSAAKRAPLNQHDETIRRCVVPLAGRNWLVLFASRAARASGATPRHVYLLYPYTEIELAKNRALWRIVGTGAVGLVLAAVLGWLVARWIAGPIRRLAASARRVSAGGLNEPLEAIRVSASADETGQLALAFQSMVESLRRSQAELLKAERLAATGKLAASVAHEIRNPLTSLRMTVEMLSQQPGPDAKTHQEAYAIVLGEIDRLSLAVEELLTFARPRPPQRAPTDLNKLAADTLAFLKRQLDHARIAAVLDGDSALPADLPLDAGKIRQLLVNLTLNALQAMVRDGTLTVRTRWDAQAGTATLIVSDTGPGIPAEVRENIFDLFVSTKPAGGGLGLAIAQQVAEEHGGTIRFETSAKGTTFIVTLPGTA